MNEGERMMDTSGCSAGPTDKEKEAFFQWLQDNLNLRLSSSPPVPSAIPADSPMCPTCGQPTSQAPKGMEGRDERVG